MPKNASDDIEGATTPQQQRGRKDNSQGPVTKRELARLKSKKALARVVEGNMGKDVYDDASGRQDARDNKRARSEGGSAVTEEGRDIVMDEP
jgi:hypothetical protein